MKKKIVLFAIAMVVLTASLCTAIYAATVMNQNEEKPKTDSEQIIIDDFCNDADYTVSNAATVMNQNEEKPITDPELIILEDFCKDADYTVSNAATLKQIYEDAKRLCASDSKIEFKENYYTKYYYYSGYQEYLEFRLKWKEASGIVSRQDGKITLIKSDKRNVKEIVYLVFLAIVTDKFEDDIYFTDEDYGKEYPYNRLMIPIVFLSTDYKEYGYNSAKELLTAYGKSVEEARETGNSECLIKPSENWFSLSFGDLFLIDYITKGSGSSTQKNQFGNMFYTMMDE